MSRTTRVLAVAGDAHPQRRYQRPADLAYHTPSVCVADQLDRLVRDEIARKYHSTPSRSAKETQVLRDLTRAEHRPLGLRALGKALLTLGDKQNAYAVAAAIMAWAESAFVESPDALHDVFARGEREGAEANVAIVGVIRSPEAAALDAAIAEQTDVIAAELATQRVLLRRRADLTRPMGCHHYGNA